MSCLTRAEPYPIYTTLITGASIPANRGYRPKIPSTLIDIIRHGLKPDTPPGTLKSRIMQTMFRESEAQTDPYEVDVYPPDPGLEILTLGWLSWNHGLPAGMREVIVIERARQKRAWEKSLPKPVNAVALEIRDMILAAIEINEWTYREVEMAALGSVCLELAEKCLWEELEENKVMLEEKVCRYASTRIVEAAMKLDVMRGRLRRKIRKLTYEKKGLVRKYRKVGIIQELGDPTSEFYGPQARFGVDPRRGHEVIPRQFAFRRVVSDAKLMEMVVDNGKKRHSIDYDRLSRTNQKYKQLCLHETKWTYTYLYKLYDLLKAIRMQRNKPHSYSMKRLTPKMQESYVTPSVDIPKSDEEEDSYQGALYLQRTVKGRAIQTVMFEGRVKCQELIDEFKSTHALQSSLEGEKTRTRRNIYDMQRAEDIEELKLNRKREILESLEGRTVGETLDFLTKELLRLQNERLTHAYALVADMERHRREAEEAGRRQAEELRRRELDEIYKQLMKVYQNSVDIVIEDSYPFARRLHCSVVARQKAEEYAKKVDRAAQEAQRSKNMIEREELVADLVYNYALPETEKIMVRERLKMRQRVMLSACHDEIYTELERCSRGPRNAFGLLKSLPRPTKHRVPNLISVKFLKLKRMSGSPESSRDSSGSINNLQEAWFMAEAQAVAHAAAVPVPSPNARLRVPGVPDEDHWSTGYSPQDVVLHTENPYYS